MIRATTIVRRPAVRTERVADTLVLDHEARQRRRLTLTAQGGLSFLLDLAEGGALEDGDALKLEDGRLVQVAAAPERLIRITTDNPLRLMKVGWHLGNRHVATEIGTDALYILDDHVLVEMVRGLGAKAEGVERPFRPERGAYAGGHDHGHSHGHSHDHGHAHAHAEAHAHAAGDACGCGHDHGSHDHGAHDHAAHDHASHDHGGHASHAHAHAHAHHD